MATLKSVMAELEGLGSEKTRKTYERHGVPPGCMFGVSVAALKIIAKQIKGQQALALELYATGNFDAMYLAGMVAQGVKMSVAELDAWAGATAGMTMISGYTVPWVTVENPAGRTLALNWIKSKEEHVASTGWSTYAGLVTITPDDKLDLPEIRKLLATVAKEIRAAKNNVKSRMNGFVISVGMYVPSLEAEAMETARTIGVVEVDVGDTECSVPVATAYIKKARAAGRVGKKRKTIRC